MMITPIELTTTTTTTTTTTVIIVITMIVIMIIVIMMIMIIIMIMMIIMMMMMITLIIRFIKKIHPITIRHFGPFVGLLGGFGGPGSLVKGPLGPHV